MTLRKSYNRLLNNQAQCRLGKFLLLRCFYLSFLLSFNLQLAQSKVWSVDQSNGLQNKWANISWLQKMSQNDKMEFLVRCPMTSSSGICLKKKRKRKKKHWMYCLGRFWLNLYWFSEEPKRSCWLINRSVCLARLWIVDQEFELLAPENTGSDRESSGRPGKTLFNHSNNRIVQARGQMSNRKNATVVNNDWSI